MDSPIESDTAAQFANNQETKQFDKVILNMLMKCKHEAVNKMLEIPLENFEDRVLNYSGILKIKLNQILRKDIVPPTYPKLQFIDFNIHKKILKCLLTFYEREELPTIRLLFEKLNVVLVEQDVEQIKLDFAMLGLDYQPISNDTKLFMENPKLTFERYTYLKKIRSIRQQKSRVMIYYISERIIDKTKTLNNPWKQNIHTSDISSGEFIFFHAISRKGFENGLFCYSATEDDFYKWVVDILLGSLAPSSVVILDNSPLHGTSKSETVSMFDTKYDMEKWLRKHNIPYSHTMHKSELYQLIKTHIHIEEMPRVDRVIKACGHEVLRLPTHFEDLSPIELIWELIKNTIVIQDNLHDEILSLFLNMPRKSYELYEKAIEKRENDLFLLDSEMDRTLDKFLINLKQQKKKSIDQSIVVEMSVDSK